MALTKVTNSMISGSMLNVLDFGAVGDGVAHDDVPIKAAIVYALANEISTIYFPKGTYYFAAPVSINLDDEPAIRFLGDSMAGYAFGIEPGGTKITGAAAIESLFIFTKTSLLTAGGYSFECSHINFISSGFGTTGPVAALKNKIGGAPARPFIVKNCNFFGFTNCIVSDLSLTGGLTTGICQVIIRENTFKGCVNSIYGTGGLSSIMDLVFCDNVSENGGSVKVDAPGLGGTFLISDNLLEGSASAIELFVGLANGEISRNYFELNTGYLWMVFASNPGSSVTVRNNYAYNSPIAYVEYSGLVVDSDQAGIPVITNLLRPGTRLNGTNTILHGLDANGLSNYIDSPATDCNSSTVLVNPSKVTVAANKELTKYGMTTTLAVAGPFSSTYTVPITFTSADAIVINLLVRTTDGTGGAIYALLYSNASVPAGASNTSFPLPEQIGVWAYVQFVVQPSISSGGNLKFILHTAAPIEISDIYVYKLANQNLGTLLYQTFPAVVL